MKYKAIFFDLDGTLLNTLSDIATAVNYALSKFNLETKSEDEIKSFLGLGSNHLIKNAMSNKHLELFDDIYLTYKNYYLSHYDIYTKPYDGVYDFLCKLKQKGYKLALISNKPNDISQLLINKFYPNIFDYVLGQTDNLSPKPNSEMMEYVLNKLNLKHDEIIYHGDSNIDYLFSKNSHVDCILNSYGFGILDQLKSFNVPIINHIEEMEKYL